MRLCLLSACIFSVAPLFSQNCPNKSQPVRPAKVSIHDVLFQNASAITQAERDAITSAVRENEKSSPSQSRQELFNKAEEASERLRAAYQTNGYFKAEVEDRLVAAETGYPRQYDLVLRVVRQGQQYRTGDIHFVRATQSSEPELRDLFPIQRGEIFSREKIAKGLENLRRLYGAQGYINFTPFPNTQFDEINGTVNLEVDIDEGRQFRVRSLEVLGVPPETKELILQELNVKPGDVYTGEMSDHLLAKFPGLVENTDPDMMQKKLDEADGWVDVVLDFRKSRNCQAPRN